MLRDIGATMAAAEAAEAAGSAEAAGAARAPGEALGAAGEAAAAVESETKGAAGAGAERGCRRQAMLVQAMRAGFARLHAAAQQAEREGREGACTPDAHLACTFTCTYNCTCCKRMYVHRGGTRWGVQRRMHTHRTSGDWRIASQPAHSYLISTC